MKSDEFEAYFKVTYPRLVGYARKQLDFETACEVAADALQALWRKQRSAPVSEADLDELNRLAFAIVKGLIRNRIRGARRHAALLDRLASLAPRRLAQEVSPEPMGEAAWFADLPRRDREVLGLLASGYGVAEIAVILDCSRAAAAKRVARARKRARYLILGGDVRRGSQTSN